MLYEGNVSFFFWRNVTSLLLRYGKTEAKWRVTKKENRYSSEADDVGGGIIPRAALRANLMMCNGSGYASMQK